MQGMSGIWMDIVARKRLISTHSPGRWRCRLRERRARTAAAPSTENKTRGTAGDS